MKRKLLSSILGLSLLLSMVFVFSSYVDPFEDDDDARKRAPEGHGCSFDCWYRDSQGNYYSVPHTGTYTSCPKVTYTSDCSPEGCSPIVPC